MLPRFTLPMAAEQFLQQYWQKQPLVMTQAATGLSCLSREQLFALAEREDVESRLIKGRDEGPWELQFGPFNTLPSPTANDWTLLVQSVDYYHSTAALLLEDFNFLPSWRHEDIMVSYAAQGGSVGPHFDRYDVFLIQAQGEREWQLGPKCNENTPRQSTDALDLIADMPIESTHLMKPGDVLYIPPGVAHWGVATSADCITWSVGFRAPRLTDLLARLTDEILADNASTLFQDSHRKLVSAPGALHESDVELLQEQALSLLSKDAAYRAFAELLTEPRQYPHHTHTDIDAIKRHYPDAYMVRVGGVRMLCTHEGLWINGDLYPLSTSLIPFATYLAQQRLYTTAQLDKYLCKETAPLLKTWQEEGYLILL